MHQFMLSFCLVFITFHLSAQPRYEGNWKPGMVVTAKGDTLDGYVYFQGKITELHFHNAYLVRVFYTSQIKAFQYYDQALGKQRYFANYPSDYGNTGEKRLFEKILWGKYHFLRGISIDNHPNSKLEAQHEYSESGAFYLFDGKKTVRIKNFTRQFEALFASHKIDLKALLKEKNWTTYKASDMVKLIGRLNKD